MFITDCCLYRHDIPVELRRIVHRYTYQPLDNKNIKVAVTMWGHQQSHALRTYGHISGWDTSNVTDMSGLFYCRYQFNEDISQWDVSNVKNMSCMFQSLESFTQPLQGWMGYK